jgi:hypothetical protein
MEKSQPLPPGGNTRRRKERRRSQSRSRSRKTRRVRRSRTSEGRGLNSQVADKVSLLGFTQEPHAIKGLECSKSFSSHNCASNPLANTPCENFCLSKTPMRLVDLELKKMEIGKPGFWWMTCPNHFVGRPMGFVLRDASRCTSHGSRRSATLLWKITDPDGAFLRELDPQREITRALRKLAAKLQAFVRDDHGELSVARYFVVCAREDGHIALSRCHRLSIQATRGRRLTVEHGITAS